MRRYFPAGPVRYTSCYKCLKTALLRYSVTCAPAGGLKWSTVISHLFDKNYKPR